MQISTATMLASQTTATSRSGDQTAEFAPLMFKKTASTTVQTTAPAPSPAASAPAAAAPRTAAVQTSENPGSDYVRPGSNLDIKV